jgi:photosystem II stability/assembly factor-like uncharacterized protein
MVIFKSGQTAFALGDYYHLLRSTDKGNSWQMLIPAPEDEKEFGGKFKDMVVFFRFVTPKRGWLSASRGVWQTEDGGDTWRRIFPNRWKFIDFADEQHGCLGLYIDDNSIQNYVTRDGGERWLPCGSASDGQIPEITYFLNSQLGWGIIRYVDGIEVNGVSRTTDGGCHWQQLWTSNDDPDERYNAIYFLNEREGWLAGETRLYHTRDGGETWRRIWAPNGRLQITDIYFENSKNGWIIAGIMGVEDTGVYRTMDGGKTWEKLKRSEITSGELPAKWESGKLLQMLYAK